MTLPITLGNPGGSDFAFRFIPSIEVNRCAIQAHQTGTFAGFGGPGEPVRTGLGEFVIRPGHDNQPAKRLKASVWCPGSAMALVDIPSLEQAGSEVRVTRELLLHPRRY